MKIFALFFALIFVSCSTREAPEPVKKQNISSATEISSAESSSSSVKAPISAAADSLSSATDSLSSSSISSSSAPSEFPLTVKNASGSGIYAPKKKVYLTIDANSDLCFAGWNVSPSSFEKNLKILSADSAEFFMPADSVEISATFKSCVEGGSVTVGNLRWMKRNLNTWTFSGSACYKNKKKNCEKYGRLYDFNTAKKVCPNGWRLPSDEEWSLLEKELGDENGYKLKSKTGWQEDEDNSGNGSDSIGFGGVPSGIVYEGNFMYAESHAYFWTATEKDANSAYYRSLDYDSRDIYRYHNFKSAGYAVRCVQNVK
ncbi:MAG: FISUMP domain-containing protein [Hallerella porci]|uniref:Uncharacterized protein (TIGR02145 family) n=1 Tax=Hallerella porci TaxID=1945871 RepID=A0ABX5LMG4_9BACT|nr:MULTISPECIES: FISUMP domain-containing protein [Hallerella]MCI5599841.1 hypothetical protein [Hallerella sp.]MDY3922079.1 FISUMP domain-containing protein [Hallerella porci]PWL03507.1 uncharacterized protein (TIGR02145 family) [Hallerella porci]